VIPSSQWVVVVRASLVLVLALTLQLGVAPSLGIFGVQGDLLLLLSIAAGAAAGPDRGAIVGFAAGLAYDLMLQTPFGLSALTYSVVAYLVGGLQDSVLRAAWWIPVLTALAGSFLGVILYGVFGTVLGEDLIGPSLLRIAVVVAMLNAVAAPIMTKATVWAVGSVPGTRVRAGHR
jgi:rod shape-determining protein MreD